ncbi:adenosylcobinamide-GDP ribazoletransferase [Candidatus Raskinella chloraquaticus]|uniref:Adenosylcobinamide-GDP ribazoletransferase n=1 Tax=Candidatus Raskinella chloraquaticus TaxID=1951219 RepID=A0A1W9HXK1_9HYPH|nr:MAG: hypothetical protein A4S15_09435 [Proteobacteria bacterium SG_bin8]
MGDDNQAQRRSIFLHALRSALIDLAVLLRFFSRLPLPPLPFEDDPHGRPDFARAAPMLPLAGMILHAIGAIVLLMMLGSGLSPLIAAILAVLALTWSTGAFHEDGLADTADGIGGGGNRDDKLAIMRDSRIGTYGTVALVFSLMLRVALLASLVERSGAVAAALVLVASGGLSRVAALWLAVALAPAHSDGAAFATGAPDMRRYMLTAIIAIVLAALLVTPMLGQAPFIAGLAGNLMAGRAAAQLAKRHLGGQTGDIAGATQQAAEIAFFLAVTMLAG